ncbi:2OG-Fe(II) oxygenase [Corallococcus sp. ZKHCc1 1396]|uniref:2OG-Fe(II) oxygenase n=1 Tax=Corallococcus soli TaxID=2710757 RepID=A0ABR9PQG9_9BACT|nr:MULTISPECIES: 2OG-Fe(II) oxygenase [Corallococcus]MBE4750168.1 2OG-Fe(II) oxygenase [Corallococcus soli]MCY1036908.1 2OG-Fe(II) oxygenase [Corallococcus sp. BB11-1]
MRFQPPWGGAFRLDTFFHRTPQALPEEAMASIRSAILGSSLLGESNLSGQFSGTYGFSLTFRREALPDVTRRFPAFAPYLAKTLLAECNAFLLNPLLVGQGRGVAAHIDRSLEFYGPSIGCPVAVSVLYVQVPKELQGGALRLYHRGGRVAELTPQERALVMFRGDLMHEVEAISSGAQGLAESRISLVVEQYRAPEAELARVPRFELRTRSGVQS